MDRLIIMGLIVVFTYYILYKYILESSIHYLMWLLVNGCFIIGIGFVIHFPRRVFYMIETAGVLYIVIILLTVIMHLDILEKIRDYFK